MCRGSAGDVMGNNWTICTAGEEQAMFHSISANEGTMTINNIARRHLLVPLCMIAVVWMGEAMAGTSECYAIKDADKRVLSGAGQAGPWKLLSHQGW